MYTEIWIETTGGNNRMESRALRIGIARETGNSGTWARRLVPLLLLPVMAAAQVTVDWSQGPGGVAVAGDSQGNVYTTRYDYNPGGDISLLKHDSSGNLLWEVAYNQTDNTKFDAAVWVDCDPDGNAVVCGNLMSGYSSPVNAASILMKYNPDGSLLWRVVYDSAFDGSYTRRCLVDNSGNIYVLGIGVGPEGFRTRVKAFAPDGTQLWDWFDGEGIGAPLNFRFTPDSALLVSCRATVGSINGYAKLDLAGNTVWSLAGINSLTIGDAAGDAQGNSYMVHGDYPNNSGTVVRKLDPAGATLWSVVHPFTGFRVVTGSDGLPVVCGYPGGQGGAAFVKFDAAGGVVWQNLDADGIQNLLLHNQLLMDSQDNTYLAAGTLFQMAVCKVNSDGSPGWLALASGGSSAAAIDMGPVGRVYMTGGNTVQLSQPWTAALSAPVVTIVHDLNCQYHLEWPAVDTAVLYRVQETDNLGGIWTDLGTTDQTTWPLGCVPVGTRLYRVTAID
jgi:hypothetical protein